MKIWAISDLHLSFGTPKKTMDIFGPIWKDHSQKIKEAWSACIAKEDLVLIPGDISWAMHLEEAEIDLRFIDELPGTKLLLKGNHDYWWGSLKKVVSILPPSIHLLQNQSFHWKDVAIGGSRLWDTKEYSFGKLIEWKEPSQPKDPESDIQEALNEKIYERELLRLEMSLKTLSPDAKLRIAMTHYPPIGADLSPTRASRILEKYQIQIAVFGHLHQLKTDLDLFGEKNKIRYVLASGDYLHFQPICLLSQI